ncbi:hypothetical protein BKA70DRAFT_1278244 [Coprinopsis sp. MPI-PUGE-AT-0042]|nr:hypothetical protein BKA70DRAFT_1278244 [Coprinopsis sp. MPI-PUGE-AT-0042]
MFAEFPSELLVEVFQWSLPQPVDHKGRRRLRSLRSTCSAWRTVIDSTPHLWSTLSVDIKVVGDQLVIDHLHWIMFQDSKPPQPTRSRIVSAIRAWFDRAAECPLTLHVIEGSMASHVYSQEALRQITDLILEHRNWLELNINISFLEAVLHEALLRAAEESRNPWEKLSRLSVGNISSRAPSHWPQPNLCFVPLIKCAPALEELSLRIQSQNVSLQQTHHRITTLRLSLTNVSINLIVTNIVRHLPNLQRLSVDSRHSTVQTVQHTNNPVVSHLIQDVDVENDGVLILNDLCLPHLRSLSIGSENVVDPSHVHGAAVSFIRHSECGGTLQTINMRNLDFGPARGADVVEDLKGSLGSLPLVQY